MACKYAWVPEGFELYRDLYPATPSLPLEQRQIYTQDFSNIWHRGMPEMEETLRWHAETTTVVLVRGFLGHYMPRNLAGPCTALRRLGFDAFIAANRASATVAENVAAIACHIGRKRTRDRLVFCAHSRGGVESLLLLAQHTAIAGRCAGVLLSQTPRGPSYVLESVLQHRHRTAAYARGRRILDDMPYAVLRLLRAVPAGLELTSERWSSIVNLIETARWPFPVVQTASWSSQPTAWLDSFHTRLSEIGPGRAHDGQYFLDDLIWPGLPHVLLPRIDHAQPVIGGNHFDVVRYWFALLALLFTPLS